MERLTVQNMQYSRLEDLDEMERLSDRDYECMRDLGDVLSKHGALNKFGITTC